MFKDKRVFISGGSGVIGRELVKLLENDGAIILVGDLQPKPYYFNSDIIYRQGDLNYFTQSEFNSFNPDCFFHLAASFERSTETYEFWSENFNNNVKLTHHLFDLAKNCPNTKNIIFASSYLIYDKSNYIFDHPSENPVSLNETMNINPRNLTGMAKLMGEIELNFLKIFNEDKNFVNARIYRGFGKGSGDIISRWIRSLLKGESITVYNEDGIFDYIYAKDSAKGLYKLAENNINGIINLGSGKSYKIKEVVEILSSLPFKKMEVKYETKEDVLFEASEADITNLKSQINWSPETELLDAIKEIIDYEKNNISLNKTKYERIGDSFPYGNILMTSVSAKVCAIKVIKEAIKEIDPRIQLHGGDINPNCIGRYFVDDFYLMDRIDSFSTPYKIIEYCKINNINSIIPTRDGELAFFAKYKNEFEQNGISVMISDLETINLCIDKLVFSKINRFSIIPSMSYLAELSENKIVVKERFGSGSQNIFIGKKDDYIEGNIKDPIFQNFIEGQEISVDAYITKNKNIKGIILRTRDLIVDGESQITTTIEDPKLESLCREFISNFNFYGHIILQVIKDDKGDYHIIECNCRYGGASTLSTKCGLKSYKWFIMEANGLDIESEGFFKNQSPVKLIRFKQDDFCF